MPIGGSARDGFILAILLLAGAELLARTEPIREALPVPFTDGPDPRLEYKLACLRQLPVTYKPIDCFFVGSSMVDNGMDPSEVESSYLAGRGSSLTCFNAGAAGLTASGSALVADFLVAKYQPKILIYGAALRDFLPAESAMTEAMLNSGWMRSQNGERNAVGWLVDHSMVFGVSMALRNWMKSDSPDPFGVSFSELMSDGYQPGNGTRAGVNLAMPPDKIREGSGYELYSGQIPASEEELDAFRRMASLKRRGVTVVAVEMPVHPSFYTFVPGGQPAYEKDMGVVYRSASEAGLTMIRQSDLPGFPNEFWYDRNHLNAQGAKLLSQWLGARLGNAEP